MKPFFKIHCLMLVVGAVILLSGSRAIAENSAGVSLSRLTTSASEEDAVSAGATVFWDTSWLCNLINNPDEGQALTDPVITFQSSSSFEQAYPDDPTILTHDTTTGTYTWDFGSAGISVVEPEHLGVNLNEATTQGSLPFSVDRTVSPELLDQASVVQTITAHFTFTEPFAAGTNTISPGIGESGRAYGWERLVKATVIEQNTVPGWSADTDGSAAWWNIDDPQELELNKTYTFIAKIRVEKSSGFNGSMRYIPPVDIVYGTFSYMDTAYGQSITLTSPDGPKATFQVGNTDVAWYPFVSSAQYGFTLLRRFETRGVLITGAITDGQGNPVSGVAMEGLPSAPVTDANGYYGEVVDSGWSGSVTPKLTGYTFVPASLSYTNVTADQTDQNFTAVRTGTSQNARILFDDFSSAKLDAEKWYSAEHTKELYVSDGKLYTRFSGNTGSSIYDYTNLPFIDPASVSAIKSTVTLHNLEDAPNLAAQFHMGGHFYSDEYGIVWTAVAITDDASAGGWTASWTITSQESDTGLAGGILKTGLQAETPYTLALSYDETENMFTFSIDDITQTSAGINKQGGPAWEWKTIDTGTCCSSYGGPVKAFASLEEVYINNQTTVYDDFSGASVDTSKWNANTFTSVAAIENGQLRLTAYGQDKRTTTHAMPKADDYRFLEAKATVLDPTAVSAGARGKFRIGREVYNDTYGPGSGLDYNGDEGAVWAEVGIKVDDTDILTAYANAGRADDANWDTETTLLNQTFSTAIQKNTAYTLSVEFTGDRLIFKCNDETISYDIPTPTYTSSDPTYYLTSRVYLDPGEYGVFDALVDDIYVKKGVNIIDEDQITQDQVNTGDTITQQAAQANPGLDLLPAATDDTGENFVLDHALVQETDGEYKTAFDLIKDQVDEFLTETTTKTNPDVTGHVSVTAASLGNYFVPGMISSVATTDKADSLGFTPRGGLSIARSGVSFTLAPASADPTAFGAALSSAGLTQATDASGVVRVTFADGSQMAFRFSWFAHNPSSQFADAAAAFTLQAGDPASHAYNVLVSYPDGSIQNMSPSVHDISRLSEWLDTLGLSYRFQDNGALDLLGDGGQTFWRVMPDMAVRPADPNVSDIQVTAAGDLDQNGLDDFEIKTQNGSQYVYSVAF